MPRVITRPSVPAACGGWVMTLSYLCDVGHGGRPLPRSDAGGQREEDIVSLRRQLCHVRDLDEHAGARRDVTDAHCEHVLRRANTHSYSHSRTHSYSHSYSHSHTHALILTLTHTRTHAHAHIRTHTHTHACTQCVQQPYSCFTSWSS